MGLFDRFKKTSKESLLGYLKIVFQIILAWNT